MVEKCKFMIFLVLEKKQRGYNTYYKVGRYINKIIYFFMRSQKKYVQK